MGRWHRMARLFSIALIAGLLLSTVRLSYPQSSYALDIDTLTGAIKSRTSTTTGPLPAIKVDRKNQKLEDLVERQDIPYGFPPVIPLQGINIAGLAQKAILELGQNYFVVRSNTSTIKMSDLYKDNRTAGKANYVTVDCIVHPYIAYTNRVYADTAKRYLMPLMKALLAAMVRSSIADYEQADDAEVRSDIEGNIAYLSLGLKLLDPSFQIPQLGRVAQMVHTDYDALVFGRPGRSAILDRNEDFSCYKPTGWYRSSSDLITFYRVKTWLSRLTYPVNDVSFDGNDGQVNNFRRSVLLYRSLDLARIDGKPAFDTWMRLVKGMFILGGQVESWQEKNLYPHDYKATFRANSADLRMTLSALAEPLYRTKLLLAVRKQKPLSLGSTSIFDLEDTSSVRESIACFKLFPVVGSPEEPWMRWAAKYYPKSSVSVSLFPIALLDLNGWGAPQAANFILDSAWAMDENVAKAVSELKTWVQRRVLGGHVQPVENRIWNLMAPVWRLLPDGIQTAVRGEMWANRRMETAFCAWLDSTVAIAPPVKPDPPGRAHHSTYGDLQSLSAQSNAVGNDRGHHNASDKLALAQEEKLDAAFSHASGSLAGKKSSGSAAATAQISSGSSTSPTGRPKVVSVKPAVPIKPSAIHPPVSPNVPHLGTATGEKKILRPMAARRAARGHFLDPYPDFFAKLEQDVQRIERETTALGFTLEPALKRGLDDYVRLFQRFGKIAKDEVECKPLAPADLSLLANIDIILDKIDLPLPAVVPVAAQPVFPSQSKRAGDKTESPAAEAYDPTHGFTMALGRPGLLYIILQNKTTNDWTLARGAVYTYYEQYGTTLTEEALLNKIDKGQIQVPYWTERFDFLQADTKR